MKVLLNKLKKVNKIFLIIYILVVVLYSFSFGVFIGQIASLKSIETVLRFGILGILGIWLITYIIWNLVNLILKKHIKMAVTTAISAIIIVGLFIFNYYLNMLNTNIGNLAEKEFITYTSSLVVLNDTDINQDSILGVISAKEDSQAHELAEELVKKENLSDNKIKEYNNYYDMIYDLLNKEVQGIFLTPNYLTIFSEEEFEGLENSKILYNYSKEMENEDIKILGTKKLTEPFTILLMGVDSVEDGLKSGTSFNGDTLMMVTFNPKTLNATMFSIPRDTYVPIACNRNRYAKINSAAAYGTSCVIDTVEQLTDIKVDYYVKINFKGVVDLVDALGGVDVDVEAPDYKAYINTYNGKVCEQNSKRQKGEHLICISPGMQHLNGEEALAYARCRHAYLMSDIARNKHQQQMIEAIAKKAASKTNIKKLDKILEAITNNIDTNMARDQILSFYDVLKDMVIKTLKDESFLTIEKTYLEYYNLPVRLSNNGTVTSAIGYYPGSLEAIVNLMKANLEIEEKELIKTFSFDAREEYKAQLVGQGITTGERLATMPNFIGKMVSEVDDWALNNNIEINTQYVDYTSEYYNPEVIPGVVANQSVSDGILMNGITELTIYINSGVAPDNPYIDNQDDDWTYEDEENSEDIDSIIDDEGLQNLLP